MEAIDIGDLKYLERDLSRDELVSIVFLLYASTDKSSFALGNLLSKEGNSVIFLEFFAKSFNNWKPQLIEGLAAIGAIEIIKNLGIKISEARELTRNMSSFLDPSVKLLYRLCEACSKDLTEKLINHLQTGHIVERQLEIHFLYCIVNQVIKIEEKNYSIINNFFQNIDKSEEITKILDQLQSSSDEDNFNPQQFIEIHENSTKIFNYYKTDKLLVLIINQQNFHRDTRPELMNILPAESLRERRGTQQDMEALKNLFEKFNYDVIIENDLTHTEIFETIDEVTKKSLRYDGLIVCLLSHGYEGIFYGSNSIPVLIKDVKMKMATRGLLNKPKILLIQACQGPYLQKAVTISKRSCLEYDGSNVISGSVLSDFFLFWSSIEGFASVRDIEKGSWFIQLFVKKVSELHSHQHLLDICTAVNNEISLKRGNKNECMVSKVEHTFLKIFKFPQSSK